jgi:hypothetical protein
MLSVSNSRYSVLILETYIVYSFPKGYNSLLENLKKGFIINSNSLFTFPILFVKKVDSKLRFYINY